MNRRDDLKETLRRIVKDKDREELELSFFVPVISALWPDRNTIDGRFETTQDRLISHGDAINRPGETMP